MPTTDGADVLAIRRQATALLAWPDREAALTRALDLASELLTDVALGDLPYDQDTADTLLEVGYVLSVFGQERFSANR